MLLLYTALLLLWSGAGHPASASLPVVNANENHHPAGQLAGHELTLKLVAQEGQWSPEDGAGAFVPIAAFAEEGQAPSNPGPLIRVPEGTTIHVVVRNALDSALVIHGLDTRPGNVTDTLVVPAGETRDVRFLAGEAGTYLYWASTTGAKSLQRRRGYDSQLSGALVIDPPGYVPPSHDRIMVLGVWLDSLDVGGHRDEYEAPVINGRSFPHTEPAELTVGDSVHWRVINASGQAHPMHLHGFFFRVLARGDMERDTVIAPARRWLEVTQHVPSGGTVRMEWSPDRPGNWIYHCHIVYHILWSTTHLPRSPGDTIPPADMPMAGMIIPIHIRPDPNAPVAGAPSDTQHVRLVIQRRDSVWDSLPGLGYVIQQGDQVPAPDSVNIPGSPLVLTRGRYARIEVVNHLKESTVVHWHGMEIHSYYDGVPDVSGWGKHIAPTIAPGDSFLVQMTPPRAGTFIYHTHLDDIWQLGHGLYGPLIVLKPGEHYDPATDHVVFFSFLTPPRLANILVNGHRHPRPLVFQAGVPNRLRFISMPTVGYIQYRLLDADSSLVDWQPVAKDGADLPPADRTSRPAKFKIDVGETYDFMYTPPHPGSMRLELWSGNGKRLGRTIPIEVR